MKLLSGFGSMEVLETCCVSGDGMKGCITTSVVAFLRVYPLKWIVTGRFENTVSNCFRSVLIVLFRRFTSNWNNVFLSKAIFIFFLSHSILSICIWSACRNRSLAILNNLVVEATHIDDPYMNPECGTALLHVCVKYYKRLLLQGFANQISSWLFAKRSVVNI